MLPPFSLFAFPCAIALPNPTSDECSYIRYTTSSSSPELPLLSPLEHTHRLHDLPPLAIPNPYPPGRRPTRPLPGPGLHRLLASLCHRDVVPTGGDGVERVLGARALAHRGHHRHEPGALYRVAVPGQDYKGTGVGCVGGVGMVGGGGKAEFEELSDLVRRVLFAVALYMCGCGGAATDASFCIV